MATTEGRLIYVMGPSGSGKDTVITLAHKIVNKNNNLYFSRRYVTRIEAAGTDIACTSDEFARYLKRGVFALEWEAHGLRYGIKAVINSQLCAGKSVIVNGSRAYLATALSKYPGMVVVSVSVPPEIARTRLITRSRENAASVAQRLARSPAIVVAPPQLVCIDNSGPPEIAAQALVDLLVGDGHQRLGGTHSRVAPLQGINCEAHAMLAKSQ